MNALTFARTFAWLSHSVLVAVDQTIAEFEIRAAFDAGDQRGAARLTLEHYGRPVLGFLIARLKNHAHGQDAFGMFSEDLWRGLATFEWQCSMRCYAYTLARNAAVRFARTPAQRGELNRPISQMVDSREAGPERMDTPQYLRTTIKRQFRELRDAFSIDDQTLLMLHVDRGLGFRELAVVMNGDVQQNDETLSREASRLRKRFERIKAELKRMAHAQRLLD